jgi:hypothetical protein
VTAVSAKAATETWAQSRAKRGHHAVNSLVMRSSLPQRVGGPSRQPQQKRVQRSAGGHYL